MARGKDRCSYFVLIESSGGEVDRRANLIVDFHDRSLTREPPVGGPKGGNENNIRRLTDIRME
jgi:hypothetical protein